MIFNEQKIEKLLKTLPKHSLPLFDINRIRSEILNRISVPKLEKTFSFAPFFRIGAGVTASLMVVVSLTMATAVTALDSVPGSTIYPLKKVVENIQLKLTPSDQKTNLQLKFANNRVLELEQVLEQKEKGKISEEQASEIVATTMKDLQKTTAAAASTKNPKSTVVVNKLADISNKLRAATVQSEGQVKIELEKALEATKITQEEAIKNIENAGLKVENSPIVDDTVRASGKLTAITENSLSIGTAIFLRDKNTKYVDFNAKDLKSGTVVDIIGEIRYNKSYALEIKLVTETKSEIKTETIESDPIEDSQKE